MKTERNSSFELLRLFCIFGTVFAHAFGNIDTSSSILNTELHVLSNCLCNNVPACFILISGYFGIKFNLEKLIRMDFMVIFFTLLGTVVVGDFGIKTLFKACFPVITRQYWFITCYFALCVFSPFLNMIAEKLEKAKFRTLLLSMLLIFSLIPTFTTYDIMQDAGKGLVHFIMIYLIGRYLAVYKNETYSKKRLFLGFAACILVIFVLDSTLTVMRGVLYSSFSRDCSVFIILASVLLLLFFREIHFYSKTLNRITSNVLAVMILEPFLRSILNRYIDLRVYGSDRIFIVIIVCYSIVVAAAAILLNELRRLTIGRIEPWLSGLLVKLWDRLSGTALNLMQRLLSVLIRTET